VLGAKSDLEEKIPRLDGILRVEGVLIDVVRRVEREQASAARQVVGNQARR
jgi:hypothetical protein